MSRKATLAFILGFILLSVLVSVFKVQKVKASGTIYIRADGSVEGTDKIQRDGDTYTLADNLYFDSGYDSIIIERDNIILDGRDYTVQGIGLSPPPDPSRYGYGIRISGRANITIVNLEVKEFWNGIWLKQSSNIYIIENSITNNDWGINLAGSSNVNISGNDITANDMFGILLSTSFNNVISGNNITNNPEGIFVAESSSDNTISGNNVTNNGIGIEFYYNGNGNAIFGNDITRNYRGIRLQYSRDNRFYHNDFLNNTHAAFIRDVSQRNFWDNGYPSGGNYWSDYAGNDIHSGPFQNETGSDRIGDSPYVIDENNRDIYPLMNPWTRVQNATWIVDDDGPADFRSIQEAVNAAIDGDTIFVKAGTYYEHVTILDKSLKLIGENRSAKVDGNGTGTIFSVVAIEETELSGEISGFTLRGGSTGIGLGSPSESGGFINFTISDNKVENCSTGIGFGQYIGRGYHAVANNTISMNGMGVNMYYSDYVSLIGNSFSGNDIALNVCASRVEIKNNFISLSDTGIRLDSDSKGDAFECDISNNQLSKNVYGISLFSPEMVFGSGIIHNNVFGGNEYGIYMFNHGEYPEVLHNCTFYHNNFVNNTCQVYAAMVVESSTIKWNAVYPIGGNYWSDYAGVDEHSGVNQDGPGRDGIGDTPLMFFPDNGDSYPLMRPFDQPLDVPVASFVYSPLEPLINETVTFNASSSYDLDGHIVSYHWDFGDGTNRNETDPIITHAYVASGTYTVTLTVTDNEGLTDTATRIFTVAKLGSEISISTSPTLVIGHSTTIKGSITPMRVGVDVAIWHRFVDDDAWSILANVTTNENSEYSYNWTPSKVGAYDLRASWDGDEYALPAESSSVTLACMKVTTSVSISTSCPSTFVGFKVNITGTLQDMYGNGLKDETVVLYYTFSGIGTWTPITSDTTDSFGNYQAIWIPPATGDFVLKAEWAGNATYFGANSTTALSSLAYQDQYVFSIESNSTISELAFNTTDWTLSFSATGPDGTKGYVKVTVAKSLAANPSNVKVYLDGNQTEYSIASTDDSWLLTFTYKHSTHQVAIDLDINIIPEFPLFLIIALFMIIALLAVIVYKRKRACY